jgi:hypothetical protein
MGIKSRITLGLVTGGLSEVVRFKGKLKANELNALQRVTKDWTKPVVVRRYDSHGDMERESGLLIENGYSLQGQSSFAAGKNGKYKEAITLTFTKK